jgi:hypothetical protein
MDAVEASQIYRSMIVGKWDGEMASRWMLA